MIRIKPVWTGRHYMIPRYEVYKNMSQFTRNTSQREQTRRRTHIVPCDVTMYDSMRLVVDIHS